MMIILGQYSSKKNSNTLLRELTQKNYLIFCTIIETGNRLARVIRNCILCIHYAKMSPYIGEQAMDFKIYTLLIDVTPVL